MEQQILNLIKKINPQNPLAYVKNIVKPYALEKLNEYILNCNCCPISNCKKKTITSGNPNAPIVIIGESCSIEQDGVNNVPFNNPAGDFLNNILNSLNVNKNQLFFINSVNCFPHREQEGVLIKRAPSKKERTECKVFLDNALQIVEPLLIICLGSVATNDINEEIGKQSIIKIRGNYFMYRGISVMPTFHPGFFQELEKSKQVDEFTIKTYKENFIEDLKNAFYYFNKAYPHLKIIKES